MKPTLAGLLMVTVLGGVAAWADPVPSTPAAPGPSQEADAAGYDSKGRRDPFIPLVRDGRLVGATSDASVVSTSKPQLLGILWDPAGHSIALINNTEVMAGETVGPYRVTEIRKDAVVLQDGKTTLVLQIAFDSSGGGEGP